jgi:hypothetical protein
MPTELISLLGGGVTGFLFRFWAQRAQDQKEMFQRLIEANRQTTENQDKAVQRVPIDLGKGVRQLIVLACLFAVVAAPFVLPFFGIPTFAEYTQKQPESFFGLIPETSRKYFVEIPGYLFAEENRQVLLAVVGFYFGSAAGGNKS